jgi:hypothetical protein
MGCGNEGGRVDVASRVDHAAPYRAVDRLKAVDARRVRVEADLADAIHRRVHLELMRPLVPTHAPVEETAVRARRPIRWRFEVSDARRTFRYSGIPTPRSKD